MGKLLPLIVAVFISFLVLGLLIIYLQFSTRYTVFKYSFEDGLEGWSAGADVPEDPNRPGEFVNWQIKMVEKPSFSGDNSLLLAIDGRQDDGTIWINRPFTIESSNQKNVFVTFQLWSESESFNVLAAIVGYIGTSPPEMEEDFQVLSQANEAEGWKEYSFSSIAEPDNAGKIYVAIGISVRWETNLTYYIDDITVEIK